MLVVVGDGVRGVFVFVVVVVVVVANECSNLKRRAIVESPFPWWLEFLLQQKMELSNAKTRGLGWKKAQ